MDGLALRPLARDARRGRGRDLLIESGPEVRRQKSPRFGGLRTPDHVFVQYADGQRELYDLRREPWQLDNRAGQPAYRRIERALTARWRALRACDGAQCQVR